MTTLSPITIPANTASTTIDFTTVDDGIAEPTEDFTVTITSATGAYGSAVVVGSPAAAMILDNEVVGLSAQPSQLLVAEDAPGQNSFTVYLTGAPPQAGEIVTINFTYDASQMTLTPNSLQFTDANWVRQWW